MKMIWAKNRLLPYQTDRACPLDHSSTLSINMLKCHKLQLFCLFVCLFVCLSLSRTCGGNRTVLDNTSGVQFSSDRYQSRSDRIITWSFYPFLTIMFSFVHRICYLYSIFLWQILKVTNLLSVIEHIIMPMCHMLQVYKLYLTHFMCRTSNTICRM